MKLLTITALLSAVLVLNSTGMAHAQDNASLTVDVSGVKDRKGKLQVALFNSADGFPDSKPFRAEVLNITANNELQVVFKGVPPGEYAVAAYHDENGNDKLDKNLLGIPTENYGFSNDTRGTRLSAPSFEDTKMQVEGTDTQVAIEVR